MRSGNTDDDGRSIEQFEGCRKEDEQRYWGLGPDAPEVKDEEMCPQCGGVPEFRVSFLGDPTATCGGCGNRYKIGERGNCIDCGKPLGGRGVRCFSCASGGGE